VLKSNSTRQETCFTRVPRYISWAGIEDRYQYLAWDADGLCYVYTTKPSRWPTGWDSDDTRDTTGLWDSCRVPEYDGQCPGIWDKLVFERPEKPVDTTSRTLTETGESEPEEPADHDAVDDCVEYPVGKNERGYLMFRNWRGWEIPLSHATDDPKFVGYVYESGFVGNSPRITVVPSAHRPGRAAKTPASVRMLKT